MELQTQNLPKKTFLKLFKMPNFKKNDFRAALPW